MHHTGPDVVQSLTIHLISELCCVGIYTVVLSRQGLHVIMSLFVIVREVGGYFFFPFLHCTTTVSRVLQHQRSEHILMFSAISQQHSQAQNQITRVFKILLTESKMWLRIRTTDSGFAFLVQMNTVLISCSSNALIII